MINTRPGLMVPAAAAIGLSVVVAGCSGTVRFPAFGHDVVLRVRPANPDAWVLPQCPPAYVSDQPYEGNVYQLWDFNCDDRPDFAKCPDGRWWRIVPDPEFEFPRLPEVVEGPGSGHVVLDADHVFPEPLAFDFGELDAGEWIALVGLDVAADELAHTTTLGFELDPATLEVDVLVPWSTSFHIPGLHAYDGLFEADFLLDESGDAPAFAVLRLAGGLADVLPMLLAMSSDGQLAVEHAEPDPGSAPTWRLEASAKLGLATLFVNGAPVMELPLE